VLPRTATCPAAPNPASQPRWAPGCHVSSGPGTCLSTKVGSDIAMCTVAPDPWGGLWRAACPVAPDPASLLGGLRAATHSTVPYGPRATSIKKSLAGLPVQQGPPVPKARVHIFRAPDVRAIRSLQDVQTGNIVNACKMCRQVAIVQCRPC
jgi:hypothetical protein